MQDFVPQNDHDLLVVLHTELKGLRSDVKDMRDDLVGRMATVEINKVDKKSFEDFKRESSKRHDDFETRLRKLERYTAIAIGALAIIQIIISIAK